MLKRLSSISAWLLLAGILTLVVSGWGITHAGIIYKVTFGVIDRGAANTIHLGIHFPIAIFFLLHILIQLKFSLTRKYPEKPQCINTFLIIIELMTLGLVVYMEYLA